MVKNIILVGFMGTGKSAVSKRLAARLRWKALDTDRRIEDEEGASIPDIFERHGEAYFRQVEKRVLGTVLKRSRQVIATGGGAVLLQENRTMMLENGLVVALFADAETIIRRVSRDTNRPLLRGDVRSLVHDMLQKRKNAYDFAPVKIDTSNRGVDEVADLIIRHIPAD